MIINTLFIIDYVVFNEEQNQFFNSLTANWHVVNKSETRQLVDALIDADKFDEAYQALGNWNPNVIGKWDMQGNIIELNDTAEYIALLPPDISMVDDEVITTPKTSAVDVHRFGGWGERQWAN